MHRIRRGDNFYVFLGGRVEEGETIEEASLREMKEEASIDIINFKKLFEFQNEHLFFARQ